MNCCTVLLIGLTELILSKYYTILYILKDQSRQFNKKLKSAVKG